MGIGSFTRAAVFLAFPLLLVGFRWWQSESSFRRLQSLFPEPQKARFQAWVSEDPEVLFERLPGSHDTGRLNGQYQPSVREVRALCEVYSLDGKPVGPVKARCSLRLSAGDPQPVLSYGDVLEMEGKIQAPLPAQNPGQFDYARYMKTKGVAYVLYASTGHWRKISPTMNVEGKGDPWHAWSFWLKRRAEDTIYRYLPNPENALLDGILLGVRSPLPEDLVESFFLTGTIHILAVSGMITAFLAGLCFMVFRTLQFNRRWAAGSTMVGLVFFVMMTGAHPPVCRAALFSGFALLAVLLERRIHGGTLLLVTAFLLALWNPFVLEDLSFQISFLATAGLMVTSSWFLEKLSFLWKPVGLLVTATTAAQLAVWCLIIYDFNQVSLYSIPANLAIVPLALFSTAGGLVLLGGSALHPALGTLFGAACEAPLRLLIHLSDWMARWPMAEWIVASPSPAWMGAFHVLLLFSFLCFWPGRQPENPSEDWKGRRELFLKGRRIALAGWVLFLVGTGLFKLVSILRPQSLRVTFLAVGHGNAVVLRSPGGRILVVDGGKGVHGPDRYLPLVAYLRHEGVQRIEGIVSTHPDEDHVGGLVNLLSAYPVAKAYEGFRAQATSETYERFKDLLRERKVPDQLLKAGDFLGQWDGVKVEVLHPGLRYRPRIHPDNNDSLVSLVTYGNFSLVLPGDLEKDGLRELLRKHPFSRLDWLMAPHHGRRSGEPGLCAEGFKPRYVVLSDWRDYPDDHALFQAAVPGAVVLSTALDGAVELEVTPEGKSRYRTFREGIWRPFVAGL